MKSRGAWRDRFFVGFRSGELAGKLITVINILHTANALVVVLALRDGAKFCWKRNLASPPRLSVDTSMKLSEG